jgi:hypothetical protein
MRKIFIGRIKRKTYANPHVVFVSQNRVKNTIQAISKSIFITPDSAIFVFMMRTESFSVLIFLSILASIVAIVIFASLNLTMYEVSKRMK